MMDVNAKSPKKATIRRWAGALIAAVIGLAGVGLVSAPAAAATAPIQFTDLVAKDYHVPDRALALGGDMRITGQWSTPDATVPGDTFVVTMPGFLYTRAPMRFQLTGAEDDFETTYALCDFAASRVTCTFTDAAAEGPADGYFWFRASMIGLYSGDGFDIDVDGTKVPVSSPGGIALPQTDIPSSPELRCWFTSSTSLQVETTFRGGVYEGSQNPYDDRWVDPQLLIVAYAPVDDYMGGANFIEWKNAPFRYSFEGGRLNWTLADAGFNNSDYVLRIQTTAVRDDVARSGDWTTCKAAVGDAYVENISYFVPNGLDTHDAIARVVDPVVTQPTCVDGAVVDPAVAFRGVEGLTYTYTGEIVPGGSIEVVAWPAQFWVLRIADPGWEWGSAGRATKTIIFDDLPCADHIAITAPDVNKPWCENGEVVQAPAVFGTPARGVRYEGEGAYEPGETVELIAIPDDGITLVPRDGWVVGADGRATLTVTLPVVDCTFGFTWVTPDDPTVIPAHWEAGVLVPAEIVPAPDTDAITYSVLVDRYPGAPVCVVATANDGYAIRYADGWAYSTVDELWIFELKPGEEPEPPAPAEPESTAPAEPEPTVPAEPEPTVPAEPEPTVPAEPEPTVPAEPEPTVPAEPEPAEPTPTEPAAPAEPAPTEPAFPASPTTPASAVPLDPA